MKESVKQSVIENIKEPGALLLLFAYQLLLFFQVYFLWVVLV